MGGFSSAFDLISSDYGWSDEDILELSLARMQQIVASIQLRRANEQRTRKLETTWTVRSIAQFIAAGYMSDDNSSAIEAARSLTIDEIEKEIQEADLPEEVQAPAEPKLGSFEKLIGVFSQTRG